MAKVDQYHVSSEECYDFLNVSTPVGMTNSVNHPDDVLVVQALLYYLDPNSRGVPDHESPEVTGAFDKMTARAIKKYQEHWNKRWRGSYKVIEDGRISPARGKFVFGRSSFAWTITCLNSDARRIASESGLDPETGFINDIYEWFPQIKIATVKLNPFEKAILDSL